MFLSLLLLIRPVRLLFVHMTSPAAWQLSPLTPVPRPIIPPRLVMCTKSLLTWSLRAAAASDETVNEQGESSRPDMLMDSWS